MALLKIKNLITLLVLILVFSFAKNASAATLSLKPSQAKVSVGNIITVQILVNTNGQTINNADSIIQYPKDLLEIVSIDKTSIFPLWVQEPSFSNNTGQFTFNGGVPDPGYQGNAGKAASMTFKAKKAGSASIIFLESAIRANDGLGTDVLTSKNGAEIQIIQEPETIKEQVFSTGLTSRNHPNQNNWYNNNTADMIWRLPSDVTAVKTLLNSYSNSSPTVYYSEPITKKSIENIKDGIWYFHLSYLKSGVWSKSEHYRLKIDTVSPSDLTIDHRKDDIGQIIINMKALDDLSGMDSFKIIPDNENAIIVKANPNGEASAEIPFSTAGEHVVTVIGQDKAGNSTEGKINVTSNIVSELRFDSYPTELKINESVEASGSAPYPYAQIRISLKAENGITETYKVKSNSYSKFNFISQSITKEGKYILWAEILSDAGDIKYTSDKLIVIVETPLLLQIGSYTIGLMKVLIPALFLLILFVLLLLKGWLKFWKLYRNVKKESAEAEKIINKSFDLLKKDLYDHINKIKKAQTTRKLTKEELDFLEEFEVELSDAKKIIDKEVEDISHIK
jgi:hypothetical protein